MSNKLNCKHDGCNRSARNKSDINSHMKVEHGCEEKANCQGCFEGEKLNLISSFNSKVKKLITYEDVVLMQSVINKPINQERNVLSAIEIKNHIEKNVENVKVDKNLILLEK